MFETEGGRQAADEAAGPFWSADDLHALVGLVAEMRSADPGRSPVDHLDQLEALERLKAAASAVQVALVVAFADAAEDSPDASSSPSTRRGVTPRAAAIGAEVALTVRESPYAGEQRVLLSRRLRHDLPCTLEALARGDLTEERAFAIARETGHLTPEQRARVDADLAPRVIGLGDARLRQLVRRLSLIHGAEREARRYVRARADRRVTTRLLDDGTGRLTAIVPVEQLAMMRQALDAAASTVRSAGGDPRTAGQVRVDTLVARVTGQAADVSPAVRVDLVIGVESLFAEGVEPGYVRGGGFLPAALCSRLVRRAGAATRASLRRLFVTPEQRSLVSMDSTSRAFDGLLGEFLDLRDGGICRTPGCNGTIRHRDHIVPVAAGGRTTAGNGQGLCERCNYVKETPGWVSWVPDAPPGALHEVHGVTEHLRILRSTAPPMPGGAAGLLRRSPVELDLSRYLTLAS